MQLKGPTNPTAFNYNSIASPLIWPSKFASRSPCQTKEGYKTIADVPHLMLFIVDEWAPTRIHLLFFSISWEKGTWTERILVLIDHNAEFSRLYVIQILYGACVVLVCVQSQPLTIPFPVSLNGCQKKLVHFIFERIKCSYILQLSRTQFVKMSFKSIQFALQNITILNNYLPLPLWKNLAHILVLLEKERFKRLAVNVIKHNGVQMATSSGHVVLHCMTMRQATSDFFLFWSNGATTLKFLGKRK